jgi:hypothetical protein
MFIINANTDVRSTHYISTGINAGMLVLAPNRTVTLAVASNGSIEVVNNASESTAGIPISLPGPTEGVLISPNGAAAFAAVRNAPFLGATPGGVFLININTAAVTTSTSVPGAHFLAQSHNGNRLLVFSDDSDSVTVIDTSNLATFTPPTLTVGGFDRPVAAFFSADDTTAYVLNCGPECGGRAAGVQVLDLVSNQPSGDPIPVDAATVGLINGTTLYVAGTPQSSPANACTGAATAASTCGRLDVVDLNAKKVVGTYVVTDGYHNRIGLSETGQLYLGAKNCTNINIPSGEVRGCLSIFNTITPGIIIPPQIGDATGLQPISGRNAFYVAQNGALWIYDTRTNKLGPNQMVLTGQIIDVKQVDF